MRALIRFKLFVYVPFALLAGCVKTPSDATFSTTERVGHGGTLDPFASGVLPLFLGRGTRVVEFHLADRKAYRATVCFGASSTTATPRCDGWSQTSQSRRTPPEIASPTSSAAPIGLTARSL